MRQLRSMLAAAALSAAVLGAIPGQDTAGESPIEFRINARRYAFAPSEIRVKRGARVKLIITALDGEHGFKLAAFQIEQTLARGEAATVEFSADRAGRFPFQCSHVCGLGHRSFSLGCEMPRLLRPIAVTRQTTISKLPSP